MSVESITLDVEMKIVEKTPVIVELTSYSKERVIRLLLLLLMELLLMQSDIIVMCPVICLTTFLKYQLIDVAIMDQVTEALEGELAQECVRFVLYWHSMIMVLYLLIGC